MTTGLLLRNLAAGITPGSYSSTPVNTALGWANLQDVQPRHRVRINSNQAVMIRDLGSSQSIDVAALISTNLMGGAHAVYFRGTTGEPSCASNYCLYSKDYTNAAWTKENVTIDTNQTVTGPFDSTASNIGETTANAAHAIDNPLTQTNSWPAFSVVHVSIYAKTVERNWVQLMLTTRASGIIYQYFNLNTGALGASAGGPAGVFAESLGSGWYRIGFWASIDTGGATPSLRLALATGDGMGNYPTYVGTTGSGVDVYGAQADPGTVRGGHVGTTSAAYTNAIETGWIRDTAAHQAFNGNVIWTGTATNARYCRWDINTGASPIDIGLAPVGKLFVPARHFDFNMQEGRVDQSNITRNPNTGALFGVNEITLRKRYMTLSCLAQEEARASIDQLDREVGASRDILFVEDADETDWYKRAMRSIWGSYREAGRADLAVWHQPNYWARSFTLTERP